MQAINGKTKGGNSRPLLFKERKKKMRFNITLPYAMGLGNCPGGIDLPINILPEPTAQNAFIGLSAPATVLNNGVIPYNAIFSVSGVNIAGSNPVILAPGHKYLVEFNATGTTAAATDPVSLTLNLNGVAIPGASADTVAVASKADVGGGAIVTVPFGTAQALTATIATTTSYAISKATLRIVEIQ